MISVTQSLNVAVSFSKARALTQGKDISCQTLMHRDASVHLRALAGVHAQPLWGPFPSQVITGEPRDRVPTHSHLFGKCHFPNPNEILRTCMRKVTAVNQPAQG